MPGPVATGIFTQGSGAKPLDVAEKEQNRRKTATAILQKKGDARVASITDLLWRIEVKAAVNESLEKSCKKLCDAIEIDDKERAEERDKYQQKIDELNVERGRLATDNKSLLGEVSRLTASNQNLTGQLAFAEKQLLPTDKLIALAGRS